MRLQEFGESDNEKAADEAMSKLLVNLGLIDPAEKYKFASKAAPICRYAEIGCFEESEAIQKIAQKLGIESHTINSSNRLPLSEVLDQEPVKQISLETWISNRSMPIRISPTEVVISMANPLDIGFMNMLQFQFQRSVKVSIGLERQIVDHLGIKHVSSDALDTEKIISTSTPMTLRAPTPSVSAIKESSLMETDIAAPEVVRVVDAIFAKAIQQGSSDIHMSPGVSSLFVRVRVDGIAKPLLDIPQIYTAAVVSRIKVLCGMDIAERRLPQDGRLRLKTRLGVKDLRVSTIPTAHGEDVVARILSADASNMSFASLGMPADIQALFTKALRRSSRVNLVTGPTGCGKTSSLYACLMHLKDGTTRIISIEDPIEYRVEGVSQIEVNAKIDLTFAKALRSVLRQDPDLILLGEIRDAETALTAMQVAQTGHLVLSSLHTNSAAAAITRLRDLGVPSYVIASSIGCIMAQRLLRRLCKHCSAPVSGAEKERCLALGLPVDSMRQATGCEECGGSGFKGRTGIYSFLDIRKEVQEAIRQDLGESEIEQQARAHGFKTLREAGIELLGRSISTLSELERAIGPLDSLDEADAGTMSVEELPMLPVPPVWEATRQDSANFIRKRRILLAEDDEDIQAVLRALLESEMFEVETAGNGQEAIAKIIHDGLPELIVSDLMMPRMDGRQLIDRLRSDPRTKGVPILMLTSLADAASEQELINRGADDFVSKAAPREVLLARINRLLNKSA